MKQTGVSLNDLKQRVEQVYFSEVRDIGEWLLAQKVIELIDLVEQEHILLDDVNLWLYGVRYSNSFGEHHDTYALADELMNIICNIEERYEQDTNLEFGDRVVENN